MTHRVHIGSRTEHAVEGSEPSGKREQRIAGCVEAVDVVVRLDEYLR